MSKATHRLPRRRLALPGPAPSQLVVWGARLTVLLPVLAILWILYVVLAPIDVDAVESGTEPQVISGIDALTIPDLAPIETRREHLATLRQDNPFAADRSFWRLDEIRSAQSAPDDDPETASDPDPVQPTIAATDASADIPITPPDRLTQDAREALENLNLRAIRSRRDSTLVAMINFNSGTLAGSMHEFAEGVRFEDPEHDRAKWEVLRIDPDENRVVLRRAANVIAIDLFPRHAALAKKQQAAMSEAQPAQTGVEYQSLLDAMGELSESGEISKEELDRLAELLGESPLEQQPPPKADPEHQASPAEGMKDLLKMMRNADEKKRKRDATEQENPRSSES